MSAPFLWKTGSLGGGERGEGKGEEEGEGEDKDSGEREGGGETGVDMPLKEGWGQGERKKVQRKVKEWQDEDDGREIKEKMNCEGENKNYWKGGKGNVYKVCVCRDQSL